MTSVRLSHNTIVDLAPLEGMANLSELALSGNAIAAAAVLADLPALARVDLSGNQLRSLPDLSALKELKDLDVSFNPLDRDAPLRIGKLSNLESLHAEQTGWTDVTPLSAMRGLKRIYLARNPVDDISPLAELPGLEVLDLDGTPINIPADRTEANCPTGPDVNPAVRAFCRSGKTARVVG